MNNRPNPGEDEDDLLKLQQQFLASATSNQPSANVKRPDKRKTEDVMKVQDRDVVKMEGIETTHPVTASPVVPAKKSKFKADSTSKFTGKGASVSQPRHLDEDDMEELLDKHDRGLAAVLTTIIERDTRNQEYIAPILGKQAFPKAMHADQIPKDQGQQNALPGKTKKKSLFAQQVEARSVRHFGVEPAPSKLSSGAGSTSHAKSQSKLGPSIPEIPGSSCIVEGVGLSASSSQAESMKIHQENVEKLSAMSEEEILEEQQKLLQMIDPKLVEFLRNKRKAKEEQSGAAGDASSKEVSFSVQKEMKKKQKMATEKPKDDLPVQPSKNWVNMSTVERDKLEWMKDLPPPSSTSSQTGRPARFDFRGNLMAVDADVPVNIGLHHHGEEPERAGYTLEELFQLARSSNLQQRSLALHTLARIISQAKTGHLSDKIETPIIPAILAGGVVMLLRWALDDSVEGVVFAAVDALHSLLCSPLDEEAVNMTWAWYQGNLVPALTPTATLEKEAQPEELNEENKEEETDADVIKRDVVQALVIRMELLIRFRYIFDSMKPQAVTVIHMLNILARISQHSVSLAYEVVKCPGLMEKIVKEFLPTAWPAQETGKPLSCVYGLPVPAAMHLMRVLCQAGRNIASVLVSKFQLSMILLRYLAVQNRDLQLHQAEAFSLQVESLSVWRVCATYGLVTQTYFDMYSNILLSAGKLEDRWLSLYSSSMTKHVQEEADGLLWLDVQQVCVLEKMLCVAGSSRQMQGFDSSGSASQEDVAVPPISWSHVSALFQPLKSCTVHILSEIGANYPVKKHDLSLPTACLNFLATYYEVEGRQGGIDEISSLEVIEELCSSCLVPVWSSYGWTVISESLCPYSNILAQAATLPSETAPNLPTLSVAKVVESEDISANDSSTNPEMWKTNMPILSTHSPFGFFTSILRLILSICRRHKAMIPKLLEPVVNNKDIMMYMKKVCSVNKSAFSMAHFTRAENLLQYYWLKCCTLMACQDMSLAHRVALHLLARVRHGDEHLVHDLISTVVYSPSFFSEGDEMQMTSQAMENMSLWETLHLRSATQEEMNVSRLQLLREAFSSLAKIRGHYLMAFGGMEKAVQDSRNLFMGNPLEISSQLLRGAGESLMPRDWVFMPLIHVYNKATQTRSVSGFSMSPQAIAMVTSVLQWNYALEMWRPAEMDKISVTLRVSRVMCAFIAGSDLFLEKPVNQYLAGLLRVYTAQRLLDKMDFEERIPGITSFYDLYQEFLEHYEAVSFGDPVFGLYVLLPLQQKHSSLLRKAVWGERRKLLRTLRVPLQEMLIPIQSYLQPEETDTELLQLYLSALITKAVQPIWSPVMYLLAVHHVNRFLYLSHDDGNKAVRSHMWAQVINCENQVDDIIYYKQVSTSAPRGLELYDKLPHNRETMLMQYRSSKPH